MNPIFKLLRQTCIHPALGIHPAVCGEVIGLNHNAKMGLAAAIIPGMTGMQMALIFNPDPGGTQGRFQLAADALFHFFHAQRYVKNLRLLQGNGIMERLCPKLN